MPHLPLFFLLYEVKEVASIYPSVCFTIGPLRVWSGIGQALGLQSKGSRGSKPQSRHFNFRDLVSPTPSWDMTERLLK